MNRRDGNNQPLAVSHIGTPIPSVDPDWIASVADMCAILENCIIDQNFKVTDEWVEPIVLSKVGDEIHEAVVKDSSKNRSNETKLAVFLSSSGPAGLHVDPYTDLEMLRSVASDAIKSRKILLPYLYGREASDLLASKYPERSSLSDSQSVALLNELPIGVFQSGHYVTGPYGCLVSDGIRSILPRRTFSGYRCSDSNCHIIHEVELSTTATARIQKVISNVSEFVQDNYQGDDPVLSVYRDAYSRRYESRRLAGYDAVVDVLADGLTVEELRHLVVETLCIRFLTEGTREALSRATGYVIQNPTTFANGLERPELLQILLLSNDKTVSMALDRVIRGGSVELSDHEVRVRRVARYKTRVSAEIGKLGARVFGPKASSLVSMRLFELLDVLYMSRGDKGLEDLRYLSETQGEDIDHRDLLNEVAQRFSPDEILDLMVLGNHDTAMVAADHFHIENPEKMQRSILRDTLLWRLGVPGDVVFSQIGDVNRHLVSLTAVLNNEDSEEAKRGEISNVFSAVESAVALSLSFAIWALTVDHVTTENGFEFNLESARRTWSFLDDHSPVDDRLRLPDNGKPTLAPLGCAFARLAKSLESIDQSAYVRPVNEYPIRCLNKARPYAFTSKLPFFNLNTASSVLILKALRSASSAFQDDAVLEVRNSTLHGNREFPSDEQIRNAIRKLTDSFDRLERIGIFPTVYDLVDQTVDLFGHADSKYSTARGLTETLSNPTWTLAQGMPGAPSHRLVIFTKAVLSGVGPLCFKLKPNPRQDPYWEGFPVRWKSQTHSIEESQADSDAQDQSLVG